MNWSFCRSLLVVGLAVAGAASSSGRRISDDYPYNQNPTWQR